MRSNGKGSVAVLSDIHGNAWALEKVLEDLERRGIERILNLGDALYGPLAPGPVADTLMERGVFSVAGNEDRLLLDERADESAAASLASTRAALSEEHRAWLRSLPAAAVYEDRFFLCHGIPACDQVYLLRTVEPDGLRARTSGELVPLLSGVETPVVLCGHDHLPGATLLPDGRLVVDPGSVGLPAYDDEHPHPHRVASGTPHARYCILTPKADGWSVEHVRVDYDWEAAALAADRNGRPDWGRWLRSGRA